VKDLKSVLFTKAVTRVTTYSPYNTYLNLRSQVKLALCIFVQFTSCGKFLSKGDCM
jgi:hypothetical protein